MKGTGAEVAGIIAISKVAALAYLLFNLYSPPCFAAIGAMNSEMKSSKWFWGGIVFQLVIGYAISYLVYTIGTLLTAPSSLNVLAANIGLLVLVIAAGVITYLSIKNNKKQKI